MQNVVNSSLPPKEIFSGSFSLGLDLGSNSIGWALVGQKPQEIATGVRIFQEGTLKEKGNEVSRAAGRREYRQKRRQIQRRRRRWRATALALESMGLLPSENDQQQSLSNSTSDPYELRQRALKQKLYPFEIGRALFHLSKRRGFKSGAKDAGQEDDKEKKVVYAGIATLQEKMEEAGATTLGEYLHSLNSQIERIRSRYLSRSMVEHEFDEIWKHQASYYPDIMTEEARENLKFHIFYQRPLKPQKHKIGYCPLEEGEQRAHKAMWVSHMTRVLQEVNNLLIVDEGGKASLPTAEQRDKIIHKLMTTKSDVAFAALKKAAGIPEESHFNLEAGQRGKLKTHIVEATLRAMFKKEWAEKADYYRAIWDDFVDLEDDEFKTKMIEEKWELTPEQVKEFGKLLKPAGDGYGSFSQKALHVLLPYLEAGKQLWEAQADAYPKTNMRESLDQLPPIGSPLINDPQLREITNPVVKRILSETRRVVNALIRRYGKPDRITIELAREAKGTMKSRADAIKRMRDNEAERDRARAELLKINKSPSPYNIKKFRLWEECKRTCVYTGKTITTEALFGDNPSVDIEHILPYSRSADNSLFNLTLCDATENRQRKHNKTPFELYGDDPQLMGEIKVRLDRTRMPWQKKKRFMQKEIPEDFTRRQLADTSYSSRLARQYLQQLGVPVETTKGGLTADLRHFWGIDKVLPHMTDDKGQKLRVDHRHHAIDAIAIAATTFSVKHHLLKKHDSVEAKHFKVPLPWEGFHNDVSKALGDLIVSFRPNRKLNNGFSKDSNYGRQENAEGKAAFVIRKPVEALSAKEFDKIIDPVVRNVVKGRLEELGIDLSKKPKLPKDWAKDLHMPCRNGEGPLIKKVRINVSATNMIPVPVDDPITYIQPENNHHMGLYAEPGKPLEKALTVWICSRYEALRRKRVGENIVAKHHPDNPNAVLLLYLMKDDMVACRMDDGTTAYFTVQSISGPPATSGMELLLRSVYDALRESRTLPEAFRCRSAKNLVIDNELRLRKFTPSPIGEISLMP